MGPMDPKRPFSFLLDFRRGILGDMKVEVYSLVKTQWDTTCPVFDEYIKDTICKLS